MIYMLQRTLGARSCEIIQVVVLSALSTKQDVKTLDRTGFSIVKKQVFIALLKNQMFIR